MIINKNSLQLSVNSPNSGEGVENIEAKFNSDDLSISFNSRYLIGDSEEYTLRGVTFRTMLYLGL